MLAGAVLTLLAGPALAQDAGEVDVALVIAVDISYSMDEDELRLQRGGYIDALRSAAVVDAIRRGAIGRIALAYVEWAGIGTQQVIAPWRIIDDPASADAFVATLEEAPIRRAFRTSISGGIDFSARLFAEVPARPLRRVIDISGDGPNNQGRSVTAARDEAVANGITLNGLPIVLKRAGYMDLDDLDLYYEDCVIGGQGAFMLPVREREHFAQAIRSKLLIEISNPAPEAPAVKPARAAELPRVSCLAGERQWRDRLGN